MTTFPSVDIRRARDDEGLTIADVWLRSRMASIPTIPAPVHSDAEVRTWFRDVVMQMSEVWVAAVGGSVVGLLVLHDDWVDQLYVDPGCTGKGVGGALLQVAKDRRPSGLQLWTFQANLRARRFYERHQFVAVETTDGDNEEGAPDVRYEWHPSGAGSRMTGHGCDS